MYINKHILVKSATVVEDYQRAPFSIATTPSCNGTPFPELLHFTLDMYLILLRVKQGGIKYHFKVFSDADHWGTLYPQASLCCECVCFGSI